MNDLFTIERYKCMWTTFRVDDDDSKEEFNMPPSSLVDSSCIFFVGDIMLCCPETFLLVHTTWLPSNLPDQQRTRKATTVNLAASIGLPTFDLVGAC